MTWRLAKYTRQKAGCPCAFWGVREKCRPLPHGCWRLQAAAAAMPPSASAQHTNSVSKRVAQLAQPQGFVEIDVGRLLIGSHAGKKLDPELHYRLSRSHGRLVQGGSSN